MRKTVCTFAVFLMVFFSSVAQAATLSVTPVLDRAMILVQLGQQAVLIGASDKAATEDFLLAEGIKALDAVVCVCDDEAHIQQSAEISDRYNCDVITAPGMFSLGDAVITWEQNMLRITRGDTAYVFGAKESQKGAIAYSCDGKLIEFKAKTNESAVNVRKNFSKNSQKVGMLERGDEVTVISAETNSAGEIWYLVRLADGTHGFIRSDLLVASDGVEDVKADASAVMAASGEKEQRYIGNKKTKKFHRESCRSLPSSKNIVYLDSRDYAIQKGYEPCKNCDP